MSKDGAKWGPFGDVINVHARFNVLTYLLAEEGWAVVMGCTMELGAQGPGAAMHAAGPALGLGTRGAAGLTQGTHVQPAQPIAQVQGAGCARRSQDTHCGGQGAAGTRGAAWHSMSQCSMS